MEIQVSGQASELFNRLKQKLDQYKRDGKLQQVKDFAFHDSRLEATATGTGFKANIKCSDNLVTVDLDLNFMLKPMRGQIEESIKKVFTKALSAPA